MCASEYGFTQVSAVPGRDDQERPSYAREVELEREPPDVGTGSHLMWVLRTT